MTTIRTGSQITFDDRNWKIQLIHEGLASLVSNDTGEIATARITDIQRDNPATNRIVAFPETRTGPDLPEYTMHIRELVDGTPAVGDTPRPEYDPSVPMMQRYATKLAELERLGYRVSRTTLREHKRKYCADGPAGLIDGRTVRHVRWTDRVDPRVIEICLTVLAQAETRSSTNWRALAGQVRTQFRKEWPDATDATPPMGRLTKILRRLAASSDPTGSARSRETAKNSPARVYRPRPGALPGGEVLLDSTVVDILLRDDDGKVFRPELALIVDKATRSILAFSVLPKHKGVDIAFLLADANTPPKLRPSTYDNVAPERIAALELPWLTSFDAGMDGIYDARRPAVDIRRIVTDNGAEYRAAVLESACRQLGITIVRASAFTPTDKGVVERAFRTINTKLLCRLPGHTGGSVERRAKNVQSEDLLTIEEFIYLLDAWVAIVWQNSAHKGLSCPFWPGAPSLTPNQMYAAFFPFVGYVPAPLTRADYIALMPASTRKVRHIGIEAHGRTYDSEELRNYRADPRNDVKHREFIIRSHPHDLSRIWVELPGVAEPVECTAYDRRRDTPHARDLWELAEKIRVSHAALGGESAEDLTWDLIDEAKRRRDRAKKATAAAERAQRLQQAQDRMVDSGVVPVAEPSDEPDEDEIEFEFDDEDDAPVVPATKLVGA